MRLIRCFAILLILMMPIHEAQAGALAYTGRMNKAIGGAIIKAGQRLGVAANDARFAKTVYAAANEATFAVSAGTTAATVAAIAGAPVWATVAVGVGIASLFGYIAYKAYQLSARDDGKLFIQPDPLKPAPTKPKYYANLASMVTAQAIWDGSLDFPYGVNYDGQYNKDTIIYKYAQPSNIPNSVWKFRVMVSRELQTPTAFNSYTYAMTETELEHKVFAIAVDFISPQYYEDNNIVISTKFSYLKSPGVISTKPTDLAQITILYQDYYTGDISSLNVPVEFNGNYIPPEQESMTIEEAAPFIQKNATDPLDPKVIAKLANELWKRAASKPGYDGLPYDAANPLTEADVNNWKTENPADYPTQGDLLNPTNKPGESISLNPDGTPNTPPTPDPNPDPNPNPDPIPNPGGDITIIVNPTPVTVNVNPQVDFGTYPNNSQPSLDNIAPSDIFDAIKSAVLPKTNLSDLGVNGQCPKPTFTVWNRNFTIEAHCELFQTVAPVIQAIMVAVFGFIAFLIVMSA